MKFAPGLKYDGIQLVAVTSPAAGTGVTSITIGQQNALDKKKIVGIRRVPVSSVPKSPINGASLANTTAEKYAFLWLQDGEVAGKVIASNVPLIDTDPAVTYGDVLYLYEREVDWANSKINIADASALVAGEVFLFEVYFKNN